MTRPSSVAQAVEPDHEPIADPNTNADSNMDDEYETDPDYIEDAAPDPGPVSVLDSFPEDEGVTAGAKKAQKQAAEALAAEARPAKAKR